MWQIDVEGAEFAILASLMAACETQPSLWPRRIVYEQKHHGRATKLHWLGCFTRDGRYTTVNKPKEMQRHGKTKYNLDSFDMVLDRRDPVPRSVVPSKCKIASGGIGAPVDAQNLSGTTSVLVKEAQSGAR